jgi:hypothetical protein
VMNDEFQPRCGRVAIRPSGIHHSSLIIPPFRLCRLIQSRSSTRL